MGRLAVKGWASFQHYKDRAPPWIKLHKALLDNYEFQRLPVASRALAPMIWLLASESVDGTIDDQIDKLAFRLRQDPQEVAQGVKSLIENGFLVADSTVLATCLQDACLETETEAETEKDMSSEAKAPDLSLVPKAKAAKATQQGFADFWSAWPKHIRKVAKQQCEAKWKTKDCEPMAQQIVAAVNAAKQSPAWLKNDGEFIPAPLTWLSQSRWEASEGAAIAPIVNFMGAA